MENRKKKILVVDDSPELLHAESSVFGKAGFLVDIAEDGKTASEKIKKNNYDAIILDLVMPNKTGFEVLEEAKTLSIKAPIIVYSNMTEFMSRSEALKLGAADYFEKAETPPELFIEKIKALIN